jgi:hypothetical protein
MESNTDVTTHTNYESYAKIPLSSNDWDKSFLKIKEWAITEKVHGSCFCFIVNTTTYNITYAKRTKIIDATDDFFNFRPHMVKITETIKKVVKNVEKRQ